MKAGRSSDQHNLIPRVTRRCLAEDLGLDAAGFHQAIDELAQESEIVAAFRDRAQKGSVGQEPIASLLPEVIAFSLHVGRHRGATWHHREAGVVWLLAVGYHREGDANDAYDHFAQLNRAGRLLPDREDMKALVLSQTPTLAKSLLDDAPRLVAAARANPREIQTGMIGGRIRVRVAYEDSDPPMLTVAIGQRLWPGEMQIPADWLLRVAAAFLPDTPAEKLSFAPDIGGAELEPEEAAFCDFSDGE
jgi:hypothetical protein